MKYISSFKLILPQAFSILMEIEFSLEQNWLGTPMNLAILNGLGYAADFSGGFLGKYTSHLLMYH